MSSADPSGSDRANDCASTAVVAGVTNAAPRGGANSRIRALTCIDMTTPLLTEGDLDRGRPPELKSPHWRCGIVDPATGAACTLRPHTDVKQHQGRQAVQGAGRSTRIVTWTGGTQRAMVIDGYTWTRIPGTDLEVRALTDKPLALRYRPRP